LLYGEKEFTVNKNLKKLEAFQHEEMVVPPEEEICKKLFHWKKEENWNRNIEDVFPFLKNVSEAAQNRFRLYLIYLLIPIIGVDDCCKLMFKIVKYRSVDEVIGL
jgi:hypothetical protein